MDQSHYFLEDVIDFSTNQVVFGAHLRSEIAKETASHSPIYLLIHTSVLVNIVEELFDSLQWRFLVVEYLVCYLNSSLR